MAKDKYNWRIMQIKEMDQNLYHNYQYCPPWALKAFQGRRVSIIGKVTSKSGKDQFILELDTSAQTQIKVVVKPYELRYLFYSEQLAELSRSEHYQELQHYLFPEKNIGRGKGDQNASSDEWCFVDPQKNKQGNAMECQPNSDSSRIIDADYFIPEQYIEVRGQLLSSDTLLLEEFTDFGQEFDLQQYNQTLGVMINNVQQLYY